MHASTPSSRTTRITTTTIDVATIAIVDDQDERQLLEEPCGQAARDVVDADQEEV